MKSLRSQPVPALTMSLLLVFSPRAIAQQQSSPPTQDVGWPRQVVKNGDTLVYYQPQIDEWKDHKEITGRMAFSLSPANGKQAVGVASMQANTLVDKDARTVYIRDIQATDIRYPSLDADAAKPMDKLFRDLMPKGGEPISLDRLMADIDRSKHTAPAVAIDNSPPVTFYSTGPAILLTVQGDPVLAPVPDTQLQFVVNTNWDLFFESSEKRYYLLDGRIWLSAQELMGPWVRAVTLPEEMSNIPPNENWLDVRQAIPPVLSGDTPTVFFSSKPAELILTQGEPVYSRVQGTQLLYVTNTENDVFLDDSTQKFYVLLSGRWFSSASLDGPWSYATPNLPSDFLKIPENSPKARVLASVPGTVEASDAVLLAQVPTTAILTKTEAEAKAKITYDGDPRFEAIEGTSLKYATNTQDKVIQVNDEYYVCYQAVWLVSSSPTGPWKVADSIPKEIYSIPPSSPVYNVTYVTQTTTPTTIESYATAGYFGAFVIGTAVGTAIAFGTGYYYPPYVYWGPSMVYPIYRPWPMTYGAAAVYNPWAGGFAVGHAAYGPYAAAGSAAWYNPATGRYGRSASVQGWYGGRTAASFYNPWTGSYAATSQGHNAYSQWGSSAAVRGDQWAQTGHVTTAGGTVAGYRTSAGQTGVVARGQNGTLARGSNYTYAGADGNVYRRDNGGGWSRYEDGSWNSVDTSAARQTAQSRVNNVQPETVDRLNQSWQSRQRGQVQTRQFQVNRARGGGFRR